MFIISTVLTAIGGYWAFRIRYALDTTAPETHHAFFRLLSVIVFSLLFGLIGKPLGHSTSKDRFNKMFREQHINAYYENFELDSIEQVKDMVDRNPNLCGFNVTIPYKEDIIPYLTRLDETAQAIGAVNTVKVIHKDSGTAQGFRYRTYRLQH